MASFQIPQFLDSGDKVLWILNLRQFAYALGGFLLAFIVYTTTSSFVPGLGIYAVIPAIPVAALATVLSIGKYNGRDAEVYVLKVILFIFKPRKMVYTRNPELEDLNVKLNELNYTKISSRWDKEIAKTVDDDKNKYLDFNTSTRDSKAKQIAELGEVVDENILNSLIQIQSHQVIIDNKELMMSFSGGKSQLKRRVDNFNPQGEVQPQPRIPQPEIKPTYKANNFFDNN